MLFFNGWDSNQRLFTTVTKILFPTSTAGHKDSPGRRYTTDIQAEGDQHGWQQQQHNNTATQQHNNTAAQNMWCSICIFIICVPDYFFVRGREISICGGQIRQKRSRILSQQKHLHSNFFTGKKKSEHDLKIPTVIGLLQLASHWLTISQSSVNLVPSSNEVVLSN